MKNNKYGIKKVAVCDYSFEHYETEAGTKKSRIVYAKLRRRDGKEWQTEGDYALQSLIERCINDKLNLVYVWDIGFFSMFLDYWALKKRLPIYDKETTERSGNGWTLSTECWSAIYTKGGAVNFRLSLRSTGCTHDHYKTGQMHTVEFRGLGLMTGNAQITTICESLHITTQLRVEALAQILEYVGQAVGEIVGQDFFDYEFLRSTYTIGSAAKRLYLALRYGNDKGATKKYQKEHPFKQLQEEYFRERCLLLGGMCNINRRFKGALLSRKLNAQFTKYDVNGLYTWASEEAGELGVFEPTTIEDYEKNKTDNNYCFVLVFKYLLMYRKAGAPAVFALPFNNTDENVIELLKPFEWACFGELWEVLQQFYDVEDYNICAILKAKRTPDKYLFEYNNRVLAFKDKGRNSNKALYLMAKVFANGLLGKFSQHTKTVTYEADYNPQADMVEVKSGKLKDNWKRKHFDYMRGAYIYVLARVKVLRDLLRIFSFDTKAKNSFEYHYYYTDTDSIITDLHLPSDMLHPTKTGKYKIEAEYLHFGIIEKKTYYAYTTSGEHKLTAAGLPKNEFVKMLTSAVLNNDPYSVFDYLSCGEERYIPTRMRCSGGAGVVMQKYVVGASVVLDDW